MKRIFAIIMFLLVSFGCLAQETSVGDGAGEFLMPSKKTINWFGTGGVPNVKLFTLLREISIYFDEDISVDKGVYCSILCEGDTIGKYDIPRWRILGKNISVGFDSLKLSAGYSYKIEIPSEFIHSVNNPNKITKDVFIELSVPEKFYAYDEWFLSRASETEHCFNFGNETTPFDGAKMLLYREGTLIMEFPIYEKDCYADFDLGIATSLFGRTLNFENGVNYAFVLPEGVIHCKERDDIVNAAAKHEFIGRYKNKFQPIACRSSKCELNGEEMGKVEFTFTDSVALTPNAVVQLLDAGGNVVSEKRPSLSVLGKKKEVLATLTADFSDVRLDPNASYTLCLPEATVVSTGSDIRVNSLYTRVVSGEDTAVDGIEADESQAISGVYTLSGIKRNAIDKGINIVRYRSGKTKKIKLMK